MIIDCVSDLHGFFPALEGGDLLIVAGDLTAGHTDKEFEAFFSWLGKQEYRKKVFISGNHDTLSMSQFDWGENVEYLLDSGTEFEGYKIWGSPWSLSFPGMNPRCKAFTGDEEELCKKFKLIPANTDILVTHSPPLGILDNDLGCACLNSLVLYTPNSIKLHVFGHIHEGYGHDKWSDKLFVNASIMNEWYQPVNKPRRAVL